VNLPGLKYVYYQKNINYYLVSVGHNDKAAHFTRCNLKGFKKCCISSAGDENDDHDEDDVLWNSSEEDGNVTCGCQEDEGTENEDGDSDTDW